MKLYLDDERQPESGWILVANVPTLCHMLMTNEVSHVSLDHDLGEGELTGYDFLKWLEEKVYAGEVTRVPELTIHSANPVGRKNMQMVIESINRRLA